MDKLLERRLFGSYGNESLGGDKVDRLQHAIPDPIGSPNLIGYIGSPEGVTNPVTILFGS